MVYVKFSLALLFSYLFSGQLLAQVSRSNWESMSVQQKLDTVYRGKLLYEGRFTFKEMGDAKGSKQVMEAIMRMNISTEVIDQSVGERYVSIGGLKIDPTFDVFKLDKEIIVIAIGAFRKGGEIPKELQLDTYHFDTKAAAKKAGIDVNADVAWGLPQLYFERTKKGWAPLVKENTVLHFSWMGH